MGKKNVFKECPIERKITVNGLYTFFSKRFPQGYSFEGESHDFTEIALITKGNAGFTLSSKTYMLSEGEMIIQRPNVFHNIWSCGRDFEVIIFSFSASVLPDVMGEVFSVTKDNVAKLKSLYDSAQHVFYFNEEAVTGIRPGHEFEASLLIAHLEEFILCTVYFSGEKSSEYRSKGAENFRLIIDVLAKNLDRNLSVTEIAEECCMSVPNVKKIMHNFAGCGATEYYNNLKMKEATVLLSQGRSVKDVASSLGFLNQNYFSARYKKYSGISPSKVKSQV